MRYAWVLVLWGAFAGAGLRRTAACSVLGATPHELDPTMQGVDQTAPTLSVATLEGVYRDHGPSGCGMGNSCEGIASLAIRVVASDDQTSPAQMGFQVTLAGGRVPPGFGLPPMAVRATSDGLLWLNWTGDSDPSSRIDFALSVAPVDLAGNVGAPQTVRVQDGTDGGCRVAGGSSRPLEGAGEGEDRAGTAALLALGGLVLRARRRFRAPQ